MTHLYSSSLFCCADLLLPPAAEDLEVLLGVEDAAADVLLPLAVALLAPGAPAADFLVLSSSASFFLSTPLVESVMGGGSWPRDKRRERRASSPKSMLADKTETTTTLHLGAHFAF